MSDEQPRDEQGRWTDGSASSGARLKAAFRSGSKANEPTLTSHEERYLAAMREGGSDTKILAKLGMRHDEAIRLGAALHAKLGLGPGDSLKAYAKNRAKEQAKALKTYAKTQPREKPADRAVRDAIAKVHEVGADGAEYLREGMRPATESHGAFKGVSPADATAIATGAKPAPNTGKEIPPITLVHDSGDLHLRDGRHRLAAAKAAGATHIRAKVLAYASDGSKVEHVANVPIHGAKR